MSKSWQVGLEWIFLLGGLGLVTLASPGQAWAPVGVALLFVSFCLRAWRTKQVLPRSGLELPWVLFLASAAVAAWISIFADSAFLQFSRLLAGFVLFCALVEAEPKTTRLAAWVLLAGGGVLALYWPMTQNFEAAPAKLPLFNELGGAIQSSLPRLSGLGLSPNVIGGVLALTMPFGVALVWVAWQEESRVKAILAGLLSLLVLAGLLLTSSRGAILGLAAATGLVLLAWAQVRWFAPLRAKAVFWAVVTLMVLATLAGLFASGNLERVVGSVPDPTGSLQSRVQIWRQGMTLIGDYAFSGAGLGTFPLVFSIYRILIHVPYHEHMHNIILEVWYEQGVLGVIAMLWAAGVVLLWAWRGLSLGAESNGELASGRALGWAGMAALVAMFVHGMVDVVFYLQPTAPLMGMVAGLAYWVVQGESLTSVRGSRVGRLAVLGGAGLLLILVILFYRPLLAAWYANLGALAQTQIEMRRYDPERFDNPTLDQVRREADLSPAESAFERALVYEPGNRTAQQRLAQIELSRGEYAAARQRMDSARQVGWQDEVTRMLLGDALAATGETQAAAQVVRGIPWVGGRLAGQAWYRYWLGEDYARAADAWQVVLLLNPSDEGALHGLEEARKRIPKTPGVLDCSDIVKSHKESPKDVWEKTKILLRGSEMYYTGRVNSVTETDIVHMTGSLCHVTLHHVPHEIAINLSRGQLIEGYGIIKNINFSRGEDIDIDVNPDLLFVR